MPSDADPPRLQLPSAILGSSAQIMESYDDLVRRSSAFAIAVADLVRSDPRSVAEVIRQLVAPTRVLMQRWTLPILYMLSLAPEMRFSEVQDAVGGISNRSLSLALNEMEAAALLERRVSQHKPPHVSYSLTERGHTLSRLSFPLVLHLNMVALESPLRQAAVTPARPPPSA